MSQLPIRRALISVFDKTGVVAFAKSLVEEFQIDIISTGGTAVLLKENAIPVTLVEEMTGFPEMMDGRVKTLHPRVHAGLLADRSNPDHMRQMKVQGIEPIDMVVVNLYPFSQTIAQPGCTFDQAIEMIDIGGPSMLRAAAKNHKHVLVVSEASRYDETIAALREGEEAIQSLRRIGALAVFQQTAGYDRMVADWFHAQLQAPGNVGAMSDSTNLLTLPNLKPIEGKPLRYGENPHQAAHLLQHVDDTRSIDLTVGDEGFDSAKAMSFNNYVDASAAVDLCEDLHRGFAGKSVCVFVKHTNACGCCVDNDPVQAYRKAYLGDPNAAMGGILACNFRVEADFATAVMETYDRWGKAAGAGGFFVEVWSAPAFSDEAVAIVRDRKKWGANVRLLQPGSYDDSPQAGELDLKKIAGGALLQLRDTVGLNEDAWTTATKREPTEQELADLRLAWLTCKHTKSNAITICSGGMLIGNGAGQMSRVMSCRIATWLAKENGHGDKLSGSVAASDAFFPFADGPGILADAGVTSIIQPGGSKRDSDTFSFCDERNVSMLVTGMRHFKH